MTGQQPVTIRTGKVWDIGEDGTLWVNLGGSEETVPAVPVGDTPMIGSQVLCLVTYDTVYCLGPDARKGPTRPLPDIPRMSKDAANALSAGADGGWHVDWPHLKPGAALDPPGNWMPVSGGVFTGPIWVPEATQPGQPVTLGAFQGFVQAYIPWSAHVQGYADDHGAFRVDLLERPTNPYYLAHAEAPQWVLVTPSVGHKGPLAVGDAITGALGGLPAPTKDAIWVGGFTPNAYVSFSVQCGWRTAPMLGWDHKPASHPSAPPSGSTSPGSRPVATSHLLTTTNAGQQSRTWDGSGSAFWDQSHLYFGVYGPQFGHQSSATVWTGNDLTAMRALRPDAVVGGTLTFTWDHTYANSGGWVRLRVCGPLPATYPAGASQAEHFDIRLPAKSGTQTVPVPVSVLTQFCSGGGAEGLYIEGTTGDQYGYGYLRPNSMTLAITTYS